MLEDRKVRFNFIGTILYMISGAVCFPAYAGTVETGTFTGIVASGNDSMNLFGQAGAPIGSQVYGTITYDASQSGNFNIGYADASGIGGNALTISYTINGNSFTTSGNSRVNYNASWPYTYTQSASYNVSEYITNSSGISSSINLPVSVAGNFSLYKNFITNSGSITIDEYTNNGYTNSYLGFSISAFEFGEAALPNPNPSSPSNPVPVPEPSTIALLGSSLILLATRRKCA